MGEIYTIWRIFSQPDGSAIVRFETNDDNDDGVPDGEITTATWPLRNIERAKNLTGISRTGIWGHKVDVYLDGEKI